MVRSARVPTADPTVVAGDHVASPVAGTARSPASLRRPRHGLAPFHTVPLPFQAPVQAHSGLSRLAPQDFFWEGEIVCVVATKDATG